MATDVEVRERPIVFNGPMVRAILDGHKTQTRRIAKPPAKAVFLPDDCWKINIDEPGIAYLDDESGRLRIACPYGQPGDRLWVRERMWLSECGQYFARRANPTPEYGMPMYDVLARDGSAIWHYGRGANHDLKMAATSWHNRGREIGRGANTRWREGFEIGFIDDFDPTKTSEHPYGRSIGRKSAVFHRRWSPIHMPRWASRITLEIIDVEIQRLQKISLAEVLKEGIKEVTNGPHANQYWREETGLRFVDHWDAINGKRPGCGWEANPWVWVITFRRIKDEGAKP